MPVCHSIWKVSTRPEELKRSSLALEQDLQTMIFADCRIVSDHWMLIGNEEKTPYEAPYGGRVDLLALAPDSSIILIELKRNKTPREVIAQALDYATWVETLEPEYVRSIYFRFKPGSSLDDDFRSRFGQPLDEEGLKKHQIVIVAASLDDSSERIVTYLNQRKVPINVICFQVFAQGDEQFLSRFWLVDPAETQVNAETSLQDAKEPWNGEYYANFGDGESRSWSEAMRYGFISAGGNSWYSSTLKQLSPGDRVWVKDPKSGFVGVGRVTGFRRPFLSFEVDTPEGRKPAQEVLNQGHYHKKFRDDPEREYVVPVQWLQTVPLEDALKGKGLFGTLNTVCRPTTPKWRTTIDRLKQFFPHYSDVAAPLTRTKTPSFAAP